MRWTALSAALFLSAVAAGPAFAGLSQIIPSLFNGDGVGVDFTSPPGPSLDHQDKHLARSTFDDIRIFGTAFQNQTEYIPFTQLGNAYGSFTYDTVNDEVVRSTHTLGPLLGERADTLGRHKFSFGTNYSRLEFKTFDGLSLSALGDSSIHQDTCLPGRVPPPAFLAGDPDIPGGDGMLGNGIFNITPGVDIDCTFELDTIGFNYDIGLTHDILDFFVAFGLFETIDVAILVPFIHTQFNVTSVATVRAPNGGPSLLHSFCDSTVVANCAAQGLDPADPGTALKQSTDSGSGSAIGIGDVQLRGKWHAFNGESLDFAIMLQVTIPSGRGQDFQGTRASTFSNYYVLSSEIADLLTPYVNAGFDVSTDPNLDAFRYRAGSDLRVIGPLTLAAEFVGRVPFKSIYGDEHDFGGGLKVNPWRTLVLSAHAIVPLNKSTGLRTKVTWGFGAEFTF